MDKKKLLFDQLAARLGHLDELAGNLEGALSRTKTRLATTVNDTETCLLSKLKRLVCSGHRVLDVDVVPDLNYLEEMIFHVKNEVQLSQDLLVNLVDFDNEQKWLDFKVDDPVMWSNKGEIWHKGYFAGVYEVDVDGVLAPTVFNNSHASWMAKGSRVVVSYCRRPTLHELRD